MRVLGSVLLMVALVPVLAGCASLDPERSRISFPYPLEGGRLASRSGSLSFGEPVVALDQCALAPVPPSACFEPSVVDAGQGRLLAANGYGGVLARSEDDGVTWLPGVAGRPADQPLAAGGDALLQRGPDGRVWHSALLQTSVTVGATSDAALTWAPNTIVRFGEPVDRNWLGFGQGFVTMHVQGEPGARVAVSRDDGATWGEPQLLQTYPVIQGAPATAGGGRVLVPVLAGEVAVFASTDGSAWTRTVVSERGGDFFPAIVATGDDVLLAWKWGADVLLAGSPDGGVSWSEPVVASLPGERVAVSPWLVARGDRLVLMYFTAADPNAPADLHVVDLREDGATRGVAARAIASNGIRDERPGNTDMAHGDLLEDGRLVVAFADGEGALRVAIEEPSPSWLTGAPVVGASR